jgi:hypothetical protein
MWMDDIREAAGRRGKTIQEARSMAMTRKDISRWAEDPTLKGKRGRRRGMKSPHTVRLCIVGLPQQTAIISKNIINPMVFAMKRQCVFHAEERPF